MFSRFVNWVQVQAALKAWIKSVLTDQAFSTDDERRLDAWAKWEAWKSFERRGFEDPAGLPVLYVAELETARKLKQDAEEADKAKPICPECGTGGKMIVPSSLLLVARGKQEYTCKNCGLVFY